MSTPSDLSRDYTGMSLQEKKQMKEADADLIAAQKSIKDDCGADFEVDMPTWTKGIKNMRRPDFAEGIWGKIYNTHSKRVASAIHKFCEDADYKEGLKDAVTKIVLRGADSGKNEIPGFYSGTRIWPQKIENKTLTLLFDVNEIDYNFTEENITEFLGKAL